MRRVINSVLAVGLALAVTGCSHQNVGVTNVQNAMSYRLGIMEEDLSAYLADRQSAVYVPGILGFDVSLDPEGLLDEHPNAGPISSYYGLETGSEGVTALVALAVAIRGDGLAGPAQSAAGYGCFQLAGTFEAATVATIDVTCPDWITEWMDGKLDAGGRYRLETLDSIR